LKRHLWDRLLHVSSSVLSDSVFNGPPHGRSPSMTDSPDLSGFLPRAGKPRVTVFYLSLHRKLMGGHQSA
jgi:hypothetical protein